MVCGQKYQKRRKCKRDRRNLINKISGTGFEAEKQKRRSYFHLNIVMRDPLTKVKQDHKKLRK